MKCDMHVHSYYSGPCTTTPFGKICRESYSDPLQVYARLRQRGMQLFTLTDHNSIEGSETLRHHDDFFMSEEITCRMPSGTEIHIGVYDITERQHVQLQQRRNDLVALLMYATERRLLFSVNHVFSSLTGPRNLGDFTWFAEYFPAMEIRNGQMLERANQNAALLAKRWEKTALGGSDAHALASAGTTYTEVLGARNKEEFFAGLRSGSGRVGGESGSVAKLIRDVYSIVFEMMREQPRTSLLAPLAAFVPAAILLNYCRERSFQRHWIAQLFDTPPRRKFDPSFIMQRPAAEESV